MTPQQNENYEIVKIRKVFLERNMGEDSPEKCPACEKLQLEKYLRYFYVNMDEAVFKCDNPICMYPFRKFIYKNFTNNTIYRYEKVEENVPSNVCDEFAQSGQDEKRTDDVLDSMASTSSHHGIGQSTKMAEMATAEAIGPSAEIQEVGIKDVLASMPSIPADGANEINIINDDPLKELFDDEFELGNDWNDSDQSIDLTFNIDSILAGDSKSDKENASVCYDLNDINDIINDLCNQSTNLDEFNFGDAVSWNSTKQQSSPIKNHISPSSITMPPKSIIKMQSPSKRSNGNGAIKKNRSSVKRKSKTLISKQNTSAFNGKHHVETKADIITEQPPKKKTLMLSALLKNDKDISSNIRTLVANKNKFKPLEILEHLYSLHSIQDNSTKLVSVKPPPPSSPSSSSKPTPSKEKTPNDNHAPPLPSLSIVNENPQQQQQQLQQQMPIMFNISFNKIDTNNPNEMIITRNYQSSDKIYIKNNHIKNENNNGCEPKG